MLFRSSHNLAIWADWLNALLSIQSYNAASFWDSSGASANWVKKPLSTPGYWAMSCVSPIKKLICTYDTYRKNTLTSTDAVTWNLHSIPNQPSISGIQHKAIWADFLGKSVFIARQSKVVGVSDNYTTWEFGTVPLGNAYQASELVCADTLQGLYILNGDSDLCYKSTDGLNYTVHSHMPITAEYWSLAWSPRLEVFCALAHTNTRPYNRVYISQDAASWTEIPFPYTLGFNNGTPILWVPRLTQIGRASCRERV